MKSYKKALATLQKLEQKDLLKEAIIYLKLNQYKKAKSLLEKVYQETKNRFKLNKIIWLVLYCDLKLGNSEMIGERLDEIEQRKDIFKAQLELPIRLNFNIKKYDNKAYMKMVTEFDKERMLDFIFYFAPFIFSDKQENFNDTAKGFIIQSQKHIQKLDEMVNFDAQFIQIINDDPIDRLIKLKKIS